MTVRRYSGVGMTEIFSPGRHRGDVVLDDVGPGPHHGVLVGRQRLVERGRVVRLDPVDDHRFGDGRVDAAGVLDSGGLVERQLLVADLEDLGGVQAVEGAQADELVVRVRAESPALHRRAHRRLDRLDVGGDGRRRRCHGLVQAGLGALVEDARAGGLDLVEEERHLLARVDLQLLPEPDLGRRGARLVLLEDRGDRLQAGGQRREALGQRGEVAGEYAEQRVPDAIHGR